MEREGGEEIVIDSARGILYYTVRKFACTPQLMEGYKQRQKKSRQNQRVSGSRYLGGC